MRRPETLSRRSFLFLASGVGLSLGIPALAYHEAQEAYVLWPHRTWESDFGSDYMQHVTSFRPYGLDNWVNGHRFGVGMKLTAQDIADGLAPSRVLNYNRVLENFRKQFGFSSEMLRLAARGEYSGRWVFSGKQWMKYFINPVDEQSWAIVT